MRAEVIYLQRTEFPADDPPRVGGRAIIGNKQEAVVCRDLGDRIWLCAYAETEQKQIALEARLERKRFRKRRAPLPPAA